MDKQYQRNLFTRRWRDAENASIKETALQIQLVTMLRWCLRPDVLFWHTPNGEVRDPRTAAKLKAMGTLPGVPDLQFHWSEIIKPLRGADIKVRRVLHLELKVGTRPQTEGQAAFALAVKLMGDDYEIARTIDEAIAILTAHGLLRKDVKIACA